MSRSLDLIEKRLLEIEKVMDGMASSVKSQEIQEAYEWWLDMREE